ELIEEVYDMLPEVFLEDKHALRKTAIYQQVMNDERVRPDVIHVSTLERIRWWRKPWVAVAAVALLVLAPFLYDNLSFFATQSNSNPEERMQYAIVPGSDRAFIILDDGTEVNLEEIDGDTIIVQKGFSIVK